MRKLFAAALFVGTISLPLVAQDYPKVEAFGGYQYLRLGGGNPAVNANGWNASVAGNVNEVVGVAADFSGAYKTINGVSVDTYTYTFGPVISLNHEGKVNPFVHALFGGTHIGASLAVASTAMPAMSAEAGMPCETVAPAAMIPVAMIPAMVPAAPAAIIESVVVANRPHRAT